MKKLRSDARWHTFTADQQKKIQQWLFDDHLGYQKTRERMKTELNITYALSSLSHLYRHLAELREDNAFLNAHDFASRVTDSGVDLEKLRSASQTLIASRFFEEISGPGRVKEIATLGRLMLLGKSSEIQRKRVELVHEHLKLNALYSDNKLRRASGTEADLSVKRQ